MRPVSTRLRWIALLALGLSACPGCVQRRMTIRSNPPGAKVYVDDYEIGTTPASTPFTYYGTRKIRLVKDGFETLTVMQRVPAPWYEYFPLEFVSENLVPGEIRDQRCFDYNLVPQVVTPPEQLLGRAEALRRGVHAATGTSPGGVPPGWHAPSAARGVESTPPRPSLGSGRATPPPVAPGSPEVVPAPPGIGGQPMYPLPR